jgi:Amt family ammonium transporter
MKNALPKTLRLLALIGLGWLTALTCTAEAVPSTPSEPTVEQRLADLEAYVNNTARTSDVASKIPGPGPGHNAWQMTSTALVLFMTLPGLALFYGGLVRRKNVLSVLAQCLGIAGLVTILWWAVGYSLSFGAGNAFIGDLYLRVIQGRQPRRKTGAGYHWISDSMWAMFQLSFAIITPALIIGAIAERMKFLAVLVFVALWMFVVYFPSPTWSGPGPASCAARSTRTPPSRPSTSPAAPSCT